MNLLSKKVSYQQFLQSVTIKRVVYKSGRVEYKGECNLDGIDREDYMTLQLDSPEDLIDLDIFAREQLTRKLQKQVNKGV